MFISISYRQFVYRVLNLKSTLIGHCFTVSY